MCGWRGPNPTLCLRTSWEPLPWRRKRAKTSTADYILIWSDTIVSNWHYDYYCHCYDLADSPHYYNLSGSIQGQKLLYLLLSLTGNHLKRLGLISGDLDADWNCWIFRGTINIVVWITHSGISLHGLNPTRSNQIHRLKWLRDSDSQEGTWDPATKFIPIDLYG